MRRDAQAVLLLAVGLALGKLSVTGVALRYVRPWMLPVLGVTAVVLIGLAGVTLWRSLRPAGDEPEAASSGRASWLLLVPLIATLVVVPPALSAYQADRYGTALASHAPLRFDPLPEGNPVRLTLVEYAARAVIEQGRSLSGRRVTLAGFVVAGAGDRPYLVRLVVECCAADARPVKVGLTGDVPANLPPGTWVEVEGGYSDQVDRDPHGGDLIPYLEVSAVRVIDAPEQPYES